MEIGTFSFNDRITTTFCHTWNGVYVAGIGSGCCSVGPCPPTKCLTLPSYKMYGTNIRPSCDFFHSKKFTTTWPNLTFKVSLWFGKRDPKDTFHVFTIWISTIAIACSVGTVSCSTVGFLFFSDKVLFFTRFCIIYF
jgi:hypothetical protein